jgi:hypothetical protein
MLQIGKKEKPKTYQHVTPPVLSARPFHLSMHGVVPSATPVFQHLLVSNPAHPVQRITISVSMASYLLLGSKDL